MLRSRCQKNSQINYQKLAFTKTPSPKYKTQYHRVWTTNIKRIGIFQFIYARRSVLEGTFDGEIPLL